jgi:hypothetical protein
MMRLAPTANGSLLAIVAESSGNFVTSKSSPVRMFSNTAPSSMIAGMIFGFSR